MPISGWNLKLGWFLSFLLCLSLSSHLAAQAKYRQTSVCEILANPTMWNRQSVKVEADLVVARPHGIFLLDKHCSKKGGLQIDYPSTDVDQSVSNLDHLILSGDLLQGATGTFCGVLKRDVGAKRLHLSLRSILNLQPKGASTSGSSGTPDLGSGTLDSSTTEGPRL
jgi:hypothetical protein